jgi:hypothetical protein
MKTLLTLLACALMSGCAAELVSADDKLIVVKARPSKLEDAREIAETQCQRRGLHARLTTKPASDQYGFDCVR